MAMGLLLLIIIGVSVYGVFKPLPAGISIESNVYTDGHVQFYYDLSYEKDGIVIHEQTIFQQVLEIIGQAEKFIVIDMFLFNDEYNRKTRFPELAASLSSALIEEKRNKPELQIYCITDEINTFYGAYSSKFLEEMKSNGIEVVVTDLNRLRDSNPIYSGVYNAFFRWFGTAGYGWLPNAFSPDSPKVTVRSYLKLLNFKANHRKIVITEKKALITSANPHDASAYHSNIALVADGGIIKDLLAAENAVAALSGKELDLSYEGITAPPSNMQVRLLTEGKIRKNLMEVIGQTQAGDSIQMGMFYLSDRGIIRELIAAAKRDVEIKIVLDANKDAFGLEKSGIPNRPVADELTKKTGGALQIRWYKTHGEQYHTKMIMVTSRNKCTIVGGSANFTRKNLGDYNLEADLCIVAPHDSELVSGINKYFDKIWNNQGGNFTLDLNVYRGDSWTGKINYLFQELTGMTTM